jgi:hypothetical protein
MTVVIVAGMGKPRASLGSLDVELESERLGSLGEREREAAALLNLKNRGRLIVDYEDKAWGQWKRRRRRRWCG